eukprot:6029514-Karenia_brevis.AAC.1
MHSTHSAYPALLCLASLGMASAMACASFSCILLNAGTPMLGNGQCTGLCQGVLFVLQPLWGYCSLETSPIQSNDGLCRNHPCQPLML